MTVTEFLFQLTLLVVSLAVPIVTTFVVKYLQTKYGNENLKKYLSYAETAVKAAESTFLKPGSGAEKKAVVEKYLSNKIGNILSAEEIDQLIQAAVFEINKTGKKLIYDTNPILQPFIQPVSPSVGYPPPVTYTTTTTNATSNMFADIKDKAAPDIPTPTTKEQTYADVVTMSEYKAAVDEFRGETTGDTQE